MVHPGKGRICESGGTVGHPAFVGLDHETGGASSGDAQ
jgi:hypothetical protein